MGCRVGVLGAGLPLNGRIVKLESASRSPRSKASYAARTTSTFSCDISYSESSAASRASSRVAYSCSPSDHPVPDHVNSCEGTSGHIHAALFGATAVLKDRDHPLTARVDQLDRLNGESVKRVQPVLEVGAAGGLAVQWARSSGAPSTARHSMSSVQ